MNAPAVVSPGAQGEAIALFADNLCSGVGRHTATLMHAFAAEGIDARLYFLQLPDAPPVDDSLMQFNGARFRRIVLQDERALQAFLSNEPELLARHAVVIKGGPANGPAALLEWLEGRKRIVTIEHNAPPREPWPAGSLRQWPPRLGLWWWKKRWMQRQHWRRVDQSIAVSQWVADRLAREWGARTDRLRVVPCGVDTQRFRFDAGSRAHVRAAWGIGDEEIVIGSLGRIDFEQKGVDILLRAAARLRATAAAPFRLVLVGSAQAPDEVRALARQLAVEDILILPGPTTLPEEAWSGIDIAAFPSRFEGFSLALLEAMATGRAIVTTPVGGAAEIIDHGQAGWLARPDPEAFAAGLRQALDASSDDRMRAGQRAQATIASRFCEHEQFGILAREILRASKGESPS